MVSPRLGLYGSYKTWFRTIGAECLTFSKTSQLRQETSLVSSNYNKNYVILLPTLENLISPCLGLVRLLYGGLGQLEMQV